MPNVTSARPILNRQEQIQPLQGWIWMTYDWSQEIRPTARTHPLPVTTANSTAGVVAKSGSYSKYGDELRENLHYALYS